MHCTKKLILPLMVIVLFLTSCSMENEKDIAYCFSMVFEKNEGIPAVTLHCKIHDTQSESGALAETSFKFSGDSFIGAVLQADNHSHEVYYNSTKAIFFDETVTPVERKEIVLYFLNNSKYQSSIYVYSPNDYNASQPKDFQNLAQDICKNEKINYYEKQNYVRAVKAVRDMPR